MTKKALFLCSSPRKDSKTNVIAGMVAEELYKKGVESELIDVAHLNYATNGCIACYECQRSDKYECVIQDEATPILNKIPSADFLIFATPVYFMGPNAQLKLILNRMLSLYKIHSKEKGVFSCISHQKVGLISTAGGTFDDCLSITEGVFKIISHFSDVEFASLTVPLIDEYDNLRENTTIINKVKEFTDSLI